MNSLFREFVISLIIECIMCYFVNSLVFECVNLRIREFVISLIR